MSGKKEKQKRRGMEEKLAAGPTGELNDKVTPYEAMGWMYGFLTRCVWDGKDIRKLDPNKLMVLAETDILAAHAKKAEGGTLAPDKNAGRSASSPPIKEP